MAKRKEINFDCTVAEFARQIKIPLWKMMEIGRYYAGRHNKKLIDLIEEIRDGWVE